MWASHCRHVHCGRHRNPLFTQPVVDLKSKAVERWLSLATLGGTVCREYREFMNADQRKGYGPLRKSMDAVPQLTYEFFMVF